MTDKSVITCDLEGRIETFNGGAEAMFGYRADEVVGKKRVSLFSPGLVVLGHVGGWLQQAVQDGAFETRTVFERKDGTPFAADIKITPTKKDGQHIGFCGVTTAQPDVKPQDAMPPIPFGIRMMKWMVITRAPFLTAMIVPILLGAAWVKAQGRATPFPWLNFALVLLGGVLMHVAANTFNDYFDWQSGTDQANSEYFQPFSGGSRAIELRLITVGGLLKLSIAVLVLAFADGALLISRTGPQLLGFGLAGAFSVVFYTAPPLRLAARRGLGELFIGLNFGPLVTAGTAFALTGQLGVVDFLVGVPVGLLTTAILWINEIPDFNGDRATGKNNLVVTLGIDRARYGFALLLVAAFATLVALVALRAVPTFALAALLATPLAVFAVRHCLAHAHDRSLVRANAATIQLQLAAGLLMTVGLAVQAWMHA